MAVRFRGYGKSVISATDYIVEIWDEDWVLPSTDIEIGPSIFELTYLQQGDERYSPIKGSECKVDLIITDNAAGTNILNWIGASILTKAEDKNHIVIRSAGGADLVWVGVILPDLNFEEDGSRPYVYTITATDGLARLQDIEYEQAVDNALNLSTGRVAFTTIIWEILKKTPLYKLNLTNLLFTTAVDWYENSMPAKAPIIDPLLYTKINRYTFAIQEENQDDVGMSCYEVLTLICEQWNVRIMQSFGLFRIYQPNVYENTGIVYYERGYTLSTGVIDTSGTFPGYNMDLTNDANPYTLAGNNWMFFPALRLVSLKYPYSNPNLLNVNAQMTYIAGTTFVYSQALRDKILGGSNKYLNFNIALSYQFLSIFAGLGGMTPNGFTAYVGIYIKVGIYYLKKNFLPNGPATWTTNSADRYYLAIPNLAEGKGIIGEINIQTPQIPSGIHDGNEFGIDAYAAYERGFPLTAGTNYACEIVKGTPFMLYSDSSQQGDSFSSYVVSNKNPFINSQDLFLPDAVIGEMYDQSNPGNVYVYNGSNLIPSTGQWRFNDTGTTFDMNMMRCIDIMAGQRTPTKKYQGGIIGSNLQPHSSFNYDGSLYILNGGTYSGGDETWQGEWYAVSVNRVDIGLEVDTWNPSSGNRNNELSRRIGGLSDVVGNLGFVADKNVFYPYTANTTLEPITQIAAASGTKTFTLPHAYDANPSGNLSIRITILNNATTGTSTLTVNTQDSATIGASGSGTTTVGEGRSKTFITDGTNWFEI